MAGVARISVQETRQRVMSAGALLVCAYDDRPLEERASVSDGEHRLHPGLHPEGSPHRPELPQGLCGRDAPVLQGKELAQKVIAKYTKTNDPEALGSAYAYAREFVERIPRPPVKGVESELQEIARWRPEARGRKVEEFIDARIFEELEQSGYFKSVQ